MSKNTLRDKARAAIDLADEVVEVPEWDITVLVQSMTARDRYHVFKAAKDTDGELDMSVLYPRIIIATAHDPDTGEKIFTADDEPWLMDKSPKALDRLANAGMRVSGISEASQESGKDT